MGYVIHAKEPKITWQRLWEILIAYVDAQLSESDIEWERETLAQICKQDELKELGLWDWLQFDDHYMISATCSCCGRTEEYSMSDDEYKTLEEYFDRGRNMGKLQDLFANVPAWIRSGAIDRTSNGFCICPECAGRSEKE